MVQQDTLASISNDDLFVYVQRLTARSNVALADLLAHLSEVERRGIHRLRACASLYTYCIYELRMSEDAAYRRSKAARLVREYPELYDAIAKGEIHLTGVLMIGPHLGGERHAEILRRSRFRSKRELLRLIAEIDPKPEVPALVEPLGPAQAGRATHGAFVAALAGPVRVLPPGSVPEDWIAESEDHADNADIADSADFADSADVVAVKRADPEQPADAGERPRPLHYKVQFTASQEFVDLLKEATDLLGHEASQATLPEIQLRALHALVQQLRARKRAATLARQPRSASDSSPAPARYSDVSGVTLDPAPARVSKVSVPARGESRHIPPSVRRAVWHRDGGRCAYRDERGERCRETFGLEVHHRHAHALGGPATVDNLELRCRPHNTLAAEQDFGREHMDFVRGVTDGAAPERAQLDTR
jgi:hypothetical protein